MQPQLSGVSLLQLTVTDWKHSFDALLDLDTDLTLLCLLLPSVNRLMTDCSVASVRILVICSTHYYLLYVMNIIRSARGLTTTNNLPELPL